MLPDLSGLSLKFFVDEELEEEETAAKREREGEEREGGGPLGRARGKLAALGLRSNFYWTRRYYDLIEEIVKEVKKSKTFYYEMSGSIERTAEEELKQVVSSAPAYSLFSRSREASNASYSGLPLSVDLAKRIASAFINGKRLTDEDRGRLREMVNVRIREVQKKIEEMKEKRQRLREKDHKFAAKAVDRAIKNEEEKMKNMQRHGATEDDYKKINSEKLETFIEKYNDLLKEFGKAAARSFLALPSSRERATLNLNITMVLQEVSADYNPIAEPRHMDGEFDMFVGGNRYGRPASEQDVSSVVTSYCADQLPTGRIALSGCGTVYYQNMPVFNHEEILRMVDNIREKSAFFDPTPREVYDKIAFILSEATSAALKAYSDEELSEMGIEKFVAPALVWSNVNALSFHRSATKEEVLAGATPNPRGKPFPRMRMFSLCLSNVPKDELHITKPEARSVSIDDFKTDEGEPIPIVLDVLWAEGKGGAKMGEDVVPMI